MGRRQELHPGADLHVIADDDRSRIEGNQSEVDEAPCADVEVRAVVAVQGRTDLGSRSQGSHQFGEDHHVSLGVLGRAVVELVDQPPRPQVVLDQPRIVGTVEKAGDHPVPLDRSSASRGEPSMTTQLARWPVTTPPGPPPDIPSSGVAVGTHLAAPRISSLGGVVQVRPMIVPPPAAGVSPTGAARRVLDSGAMTQAIPSAGLRIVGV